MQIEISKPCPPHQWVHAPTVGYFRCQKCGECVCIDDPRYADLEREQAQNYAPEPINSAALDELAQIDRDLIDVPVTDRLFPAEAWNELTEYDDRTSPAEYPDMALITFDELASFMARAHPNECTCCDVVGENPDCVVHGALAGEISGLEAEVERQEGLVKVYRQAQLTAEEKLCRAEADAMGQKGRAKYLEETLAAEREKVAGVVVALEGVTELAHGYAEYIASVPSQELERHPYLPGVEDAISAARTALAKRKEGE